MKSNSKIATICTDKAYAWMQQWINFKCPNNKYPLTPEQYFYTNTSHREYLSKFIESVISLVLRDEGADVIDSSDKGQKIDTSKTYRDVLGHDRRTNESVYVKSGNVRPGRADRKAFVFGKMYNFEVKVNKDTQSDLQKKEQARAEANGEIYIIIKTVDDFMTWYEANKPEEIIIRRRAV
jgi:hypothetical protein